MEYSGFGNATVSYGLTRPNSVFNGFVQAMLEEGLLKSHVTPMIVTHNGRPANFLSGGEMPVPVSAGLSYRIEFREFGIQMNAVPYILGNGRVRLEVETIIRDRDFANSATIAGTTTTAFKTNSANTQVEMNLEKPSSSPVWFLVVKTVRLRKCRSSENYLTSVRLSVAKTIPSPKLSWSFWSLRNMSLRCRPGNCLSAVGQEH